MRLLGLGLVLLGTALGLAFGCGAREGGSGTQTAAAGASTSGAGTSAGRAGGDATAGNATAGNATAGNATAGNATAGNATAGNATAGSVAGGASAGSSTTGGQPDAQAGANNDGGASGLVDCDPKKILCKRLAPQCDAGEVPSVNGSCYGDCVKVEQCGCSAAAECPEPDQYTCWAKQHCGPFVQ